MTQGVPLVHFRAMGRMRYDAVGGIVATGAASRAPVAQHGRSSLQRQSAVATCSRRTMPWRRPTYSLVFRIQQSSSSAPVAAAAPIERLLRQPRSTTYEPEAPASAWHNPTRRAQAQI